MLDRSPDNGRVVHRRHNDGRQRFVLAADVCEGGEATDARHIQVEQQQISLGVCFDNDLQSIEAVRLDDVRGVYAVADRMNQRLTK